MRQFAMYSDTQIYAEHKFRPNYARMPYGRFGTSHHSDSQFRAPHDCQGATGSKRRRNPLNLLLRWILRPLQNHIAQNRTFGSMRLAVAPRFRAGWCRIMNMESIWVVY